MTIPFPSWPLPSIDTVLKAFRVEDFARPEFQSALMAKVALEAEKANVDQAAAEEAIAALHLEEIALAALFFLARNLLFACTGGLHC